MENRDERWKHDRGASMVRLEEMDAFGDETTAPSALYNHRY
jgi:hypothetical protein